MSYSADPTVIGGENWCADCAYVRASPNDASVRRMVYRACQTPGCPSWNKKNKRRNRPSVLDKKRYA